ncbi:MAG: phosphotransferase [Myxococcales bacterium]|nr:phosphotransferase [Myxococcales bacterium]
MAANVVLDREEVRSILSLYHLEDLEDFGGNAKTTAYTSYWVKAGGRRYDLRITERKTLDDMVYEKDLLLQLKRAGLPVPSLVRNVARGTFTPWARRGRYVSLFEHMPGRALGIFEVRARHVRTVGRLLGDIHRATSSFRRRRTNPWGISTMLEKQGRLDRALTRRRLAQRFEPVVSVLGEALQHQETRLLRSVLPLGAIHGDLTISRGRYQRDFFVGTVEFESACRDRLVMDLATSLSSWCWEPSPKQRGGPAGRFRLTKVRAMIDGYQRTRPLTNAERDALPDELRFVAIRDSIRRLIQCELNRSRDPARSYEDYRHCTARLEALSDGRAERLVQRAIG